MLIPQWVQKLYHFLFVDGYVRPTKTRHANVISLSTRQPILPVAEVDVSAAPIVRIKRQGKVIEEVDITKSRLPDAMEQWKKEYSLMFDENWPDFWVSWKGYL